MFPFFVIILETLLHILLAWTSALQLKNSFKLRKTHRTFGFLSDPFKIRFCLPEEQFWRKVLFLKQKRVAFSYLIMTS